MNTFRKVKRMRKKHIKEFIKEIKNSEYDYYDYDSLHRLFLLHLTQMHEFYEADMFKEGIRNECIANSIKSVIEKQKQLDKIQSALEVKFDYTEYVRRTKDLYKSLYEHVGNNLQDWWY